MIAVVKATLVVLFFMHAIHSPRVTWCVIVVSIVLFVDPVLVDVVGLSSRGRSFPTCPDTKRGTTVATLLNTQPPRWRSAWRHSCWQ